MTHFLDLRAAYFLTIPFTMCAFLALYYFREPKEHKRGVNKLIGAHITSIFKAIIQRGKLLWIVLALVVLTIELRLMLEFNQLWIIALAVPVVLFGPIGALLISSVGIAGSIANRLNSRKLVLTTGLIVLLSSLVLLTKHRLLVVVAELLILIGSMILNIIFTKYLHDTLSSKIRVGASSVVTTLGYLLFLPFAFIFGVISTKDSIFKASWIVIVLAVVLLICISAVIKNRRETN